MLVLLACCCCLALEFRLCLGVDFLVADFRLCNLCRLNMVAGYVDSY